MKSADLTKSRFAALEIEGNEPSQNSQKAVAVTTSATVITSTETPKFLSSPDISGMERGRKAVRYASGQTANALGLESTPEHLHVARAWQEKCKPMTETIQAVEAKAPLKSDMLISAKDMQISGDFRLKGLELTPRGIQRASRLTGVPKPMIDYMLAHDDAAGLITHLNRELQTTTERDPEKKYLLRTIRDEVGSDPKIRAIFSDSYAPINNTDALRMIRQALPGADCSNVLTSRFEDGEDGMTGTFFLPDAMKALPDSDYGVGLAVKNSEVGKMAYEVLPFVFRAVCLNGMIWGRMDQAIKIRQIHSGNIDFAQLQEQVTNAVQSALAHGAVLLDTLQATKQIEVKKHQNMIALLSERFGLNRDQGRAWDEAFNVEPDASAFGILNGLTRAAQAFDGSVRTEMEAAAGQILMPSLESDMRTIMSRWERFEADANELKSEQVVRLFAAR